jgi:hypothetical protein
MNINELFELLQDNISEELNGEITLYENTITWSYTLENIEDDEEHNDIEDDEDFFFAFESTSSEEKLIEIYYNDLETIQTTLLEYDENDNWSLNEYIVKDNSISFKIT